MSDQPNKEFFIGWEGKAPEGIGKSLRHKLIFVPLFIIIGVVIASRQGSIGDGAKESGKREFTGVLISDPVPMLVTPEREEVSGTSVFYLVNPMKKGFDLELARTNNLKSVTLTGVLLHRDGEAMIEVAPDSLESGGSSGDPLGKPESLGVMTLQGEIVDSKCYLGQMTPGNLKTHRACAIHCISGGVPPVLLVRSESGGANLFLLTDEDGKPVNDRVLDLVALPIEITGTVEKMGELVVLKASPDTYRRLDK